MNKLNKYRAIYRCPMCLKKFTVGNPVELEENQVPELLCKIVRNQQMMGNPYLYQAPMHIPHRCENGDGGLAQLAGFEKIRR